MVVPRAITPSYSSRSSARAGDSVGKGDAEKVVEQFHQQLDGGQYELIYDGADEAFEAVMKKADFTQILTVIHTKLGNVRTTQQVGFQTQERVGTLSGSFVMLQYRTQFAEGDGVETFNYRVGGNKASLVGYNINSAALITE